MELKIKPIGTRVVVEADQAEEKTASGIYIPNTAKEKPQKGTVTAVGDDVKDESATVKVGDNVIFGKYSGTELRWEGKDYLIMKENEIFGILS